MLPFSIMRILRECALFKQIPVSKLHGIAGSIKVKYEGADPGFQEIGFICASINVCVWGLALLILSHFFKYPMKMK